MNTKAVVCDTSTLIRLYKGNVLRCLAGLFEKIYLPRAVQEECRDELVIAAIQKPPFELCQVQKVLALEWMREKEKP